MVALGSRSPALLQTQVLSVSRPCAGAVVVLEAACAVSGVRVMSAVVVSVVSSFFMVVWGGCWFLFAGFIVVGWWVVGQIGVFSGVRVQYDKGILRALWEGRRIL